MPQTTNHPKLPTSIHVVSVLISVFFTLFQAVYWLFIGIKWLFAPIMLVFNIFIAIPYGKFFVKLPLTLDTHSIDECKLPTSIWWHFKEVSLELARMGFEVGNYLEIRNFAPNINTFFMSMVNHEKNQGAGILISVPKKTRLEDTELPPEAIHSVEFTTYDSEKMIIDFTTQPTPDPFPFLKNRQRLFADDLPEFALYNLFDQFEKKTGCSLSATTLSQLYDNPATIIHSEYLMLVNHSLQQHFIKKAATNYTMTWKGAMTNGLRTVWPTSVWYKHKDQKKLSTIMEQAGIKVDKCWEYGGETLISHPLEAPLLSLDKALEHSKSLLNKHFSLPSKLESVDILNPEKDKPKLIFSFQTVELFPKRNAVVQGLVKIVIDNIDSQYYFWHQK